MNPSFWNHPQQPQQLLMWINNPIQCNSQSRGPLPVNNYNFFPRNPFPVNNHNFFSQYPFPVNNHNLFPQNPFPRHTRPEQLNSNGLLPIPNQQRRFPNCGGTGPEQQPHSFLLQQTSTSKSCYQFEEIKLARRSLGIYVDQVHPSQKSWQPLKQDSLPNRWEGEGGMMEHCTQPFPLPMKGQVTSRAPVWCPQDNTQENTTTSFSSVNITASKNATPKTTCGEGEDLRTDVVSMSDADDDSDVQVVAFTTTREASEPIIIEDSPKPSRHSKNQQILGSY
ncbi:hypothetical protein RRG08_026682 [Elysia crispata]|uniref:Uncharacterized protein n=1 Tax=Elysia crispata TaxID=231223 RepID=A0AAE1E756_9GAST|nr:hypothetical protein RRG08_026682 [Elysia crispata]